MSIGLKVDTSFKEFLILQLFNGTFDPNPSYRNDKRIFIYAFFPKSEMKFENSHAGTMNGRH